MFQYISYIMDVLVNGGIFLMFLKFYALSKRFKEAHFKKKLEVEELFPQWQCHVAMLA